MFKRWLILLLLGFISGTGSMEFLGVLESSSKSQAYPLVSLSANPKELIDEVWQIVNQRYIDSTFNKQDWNRIRQDYLNRSYANQDEVYQAIKKMLETLNDPLTRFMTPQEFLSIQDSSRNASVTGITILENKATKNLVIFPTYENSSTFKTGILPGDILVEIDGIGVEKMHSYQANDLLKGLPETNVVLTVKRGQQKIDFTIKRELIPESSVYWRSDRLPVGQIAYIRFNRFTAMTPTQIRQAIQELEQQQVAGYILDLRSNPGGLLSSVFEVANFWLNQEIIVTLVAREGKIESRQAKGNALTNKPLVILVNEGTASGGEILASALQENQRAILVGNQTAGYNTIQSVRSLQDGSGLAVTVAKWVTPKGKDIADVGLTPDIVVSLTQSQQLAMADRRLVGTQNDPQYAKATESLVRLLSQK